MNHRETILRVYVALAGLSCARSSPPPDDHSPEAAAPVASAPRPSPAASAAGDASAPKLPATPAAVHYEDEADVPAEPGDARCPDAPAPNAKPASVKLELATNPPGLDISIPSLGVKQRLWPNATSPTSCRASTSTSSMRFRCSDDASAVDGKVYVRRSNIVLGRASMTGTTQTLFLLPCGTPGKLEPVACPAGCRQVEAQCTCAATPKN